MRQPCFSVLIEAERERESVRVLVLVMEDVKSGLGKDDPLTDFMIVGFSFAPQS